MLVQVGFWLTWGRLFGRVGPTEVNPVSRRLPPREPGRLSLQTGV
jgi:hypothetical protein